MPSETDGSPRSTFWRVMRVMKARSAMMVVGMRRRSRALRISSPSLASARLTGRGRGGVLRMKRPSPLMYIFLYYTSINVQLNRHYKQRLADISKTWPSHADGADRPLRHWG